MDNLGALSGYVLERVRVLPSPDRVLDLGCGPGGIAIELARTPTCEVVGVDGCDAFLDRARKRAHGLGVGARCEFVQRDLRDWHRWKAWHGAFDLVLMLNVWPVEFAAPRARRFVRPGGHYMLDDAFSPEDSPIRGVPTLREAVERVRAMGDRVVHAELIPAEVAAAGEAALQRQLKTNATRLAREKPELRRALKTFVEGQAAAAESLRSEVRAGMIVAENDTFLSGPKCDDLMPMPRTQLGMRHIEL